MIKIYDLNTNSPVGEITEAQFQFLADHFEEESPDDRDYYLNRITVDMLEEQGGDPGLIAVLREALGNREEMDIRWVRE
ncbi:MAG TPA: galactosyldiacylglycerol synthase [Anaerolineae bacterium]|nr:galactosyldiacylglycerol synthase [Anaerolineae bacterium]